MPRSSVHARSLFKDHQVTPIGPMLRAADSIFIADVVAAVKFFESGNGETSVRFVIKSCFKKQPFAVSSTHFSS